MQFLISTNDLKHDPEFNRLLGAYALAKMNLVAYFNKAMAQDISNASLRDQIQAEKSGE